MYFRSMLEQSMRRSLHGKRWQRFRDRTDRRLSKDCSGFYDFGSGSQRVLLYCGTAASTTSRCGSAGAFCLATDGSGFGAAPSLCISGQCFEYACTDPSPTPGLRKRADWPTRPVVPLKLCPAGFLPCPLYPKGFECVDVLNDIESCGGCVGRNMPGRDCSADVHAAVVSCINGECVISECDEGFSIAAENNTCIAM
ncbi:hypothetical protein NliqN6_4423 [Naganishia liquefaciens]|uniref:Protein CPL1-like domain-containing protein n=1 Tax=Naganishia liquefaciens TaxID=104408 RepID=A0A8H3TUY4_9TREE|nr:hypothetical protein NliqN6_4423 [Naganishia liquefaciens]